LKSSILRKNGGIIENAKFKQYCWKATVEDIKKRNYNLDIVNPNNLSEIDNQSKNEILDRLKKNSTAILDLLNEISKAFEDGSD
jgi:hypothetical protein